MIHVLAALGGGGIGYLIGKYMSKAGFGCPLICDPRISTIYFALIGLFLSFK
ncbi:hypothetical protein [Caldithrix abyssi]|uniref:Uncharacterized protein n=1 Tax=Caldithrix abyssi DSM 13497 TaxID=880073 RepID=H1XW93_CALAY|nr:hypothetical protein [Caldithrix abyssi]APF19054.1 hypothetical protein Cabys_2305 [Caldithrix abyssi DSM 13497]EHO42998.1 hypothetical protein Calab_3395 [Caldithrix abyssi DSM 13497]